MDFLGGVSSLTKWQARLGVTFMAGGSGFVGLGTMFSNPLGTLNLTNGVIGAVAFGVVAFIASIFLIRE